MPATTKPMLSLQDELIFEEGLKLVPYKDSLGRWACGVGCDLAANGLLDAQGQPILSKWTRDEALVRLEKNIKVAIADLQSFAPWAHTLDPVRERVLIDMAFQMGRSKMRLFKATLAAIQTGAYTQAADHMLASLWATQCPKRARRMAYRMRTGLYWAPNGATP